MKSILAIAMLALSGVATAQTQTITTTTETIREESTVITVTQSGNTTTRSSVPIVYRCNGQTCAKP
jgi:hypothetical protein